LLAQYFGIHGAADAPAMVDRAAMAAENGSRTLRLATLQWRPDGAVIKPDDGQQRDAASHLLVESTGPGPHAIEGTLTDVNPDVTTVLSFPVRSFGTRGILVELRANGQHGGGYCDLPGATAQRDGDMLDVGLDVQPDGWSRCWVAMKPNASTVTVRLSLMDEHLDPSYRGDGGSGVAIGDMERRETAHFLHKEAAPW